MDRFLEFVVNHYLLFGTLVALVAAYIATEMSRGGESVSPQGLSVLTNRENARVIDVRDVAEFKAGHITGSENIPYSRITERLDELKKELERPIVIVCNLGQVAGTVGRQLKTAGMTRVYKLEGGISNWKSQSLPLVKK
ncbi:MAG: rhodanese-like domain-containing protein [Moraxellaceae bacterium]|nr:rhodanese-like domain-containing protein [Moraxellaceae bacterium]